MRGQVAARAQRFEVRAPVVARVAIAVVDVERRRPRSAAATLLADHALAQPAPGSGRAALPAMFVRRCQGAPKSAPTSGAEKCTMAPVEKWAT